MINYAILLAVFVSLAAAQKPKCPINSVCFAIDNSGSISNQEYKQEIRFVKQIASEIGAQTSNTIYSAYGFSSLAFPMQTGTRNLNGVFKPAITKFKRIEGKTNMRAGLMECFDEIKNDKGNRVVVLVTDGRDTSSPGALDFSPVVKKTKVSIVTVGVGDKLNEQYLRDLASSPDFFVKASGFSKLQENVVDVVESSCKAATKPVKPVNPGNNKPSKAGSCGKAYKDCDFRFKGTTNVPTYSTGGKADVPFTRLIVGKSEKIGVLNMNGVIPEFIGSDGVAREIIGFGSPNYTPTHFKPFSIKKTRGSGIGHETFRGDQFPVSRKKCIRVFFTHYQRFVGKNMVENVVVTKKDKKCVVFRTK